jgi:hypothetical protein
MASLAPSGIPCRTRGPSGDYAARDEKADRSACIVHATGGEVTCSGRRDPTTSHPASRARGPDANRPRRLGLPARRSAGARGISLFLVPKFIPRVGGALGPRNDMSVGSLEHKMGINASPTCVMNYDGARGWLVGEPHRGLAAMFTMMNAERPFVGMQGLGIAEAAYQNAVAYARERRQDVKSEKYGPAWQTTQ